MNTELKAIDLNDYPILFQKNNLGKDGKYLHVETIEPSKVLMESGWQPRQVVTINPRVDYRKGFQKHRVRFFNPDIKNVNGSHVELMLTNSYDGKSAFQIELGVFRMVCSNGLVVGDTYNKESVRHLGYSDSKVYDAVNNILPQTTQIIDTIDRLSSINLDKNELKVFGESILEMRLDTENDDKWIIDDFAVNNLFRPHRHSDTKTDLWTNFNTAQENLTKFGLQVKHKDERYTNYTPRKKVQALKNTFRSDSLNKTLWTMAEKMYELKTQRH